MVKKTKDLCVNLKYKITFVVTVRKSKETDFLYTCRTLDQHSALFQRESFWLNWTDAKCIYMYQSNGNNLTIINIVLKAFLFGSKNIFLRLHLSYIKVILSYIEYQYLAFFTMQKLFKCYFMIFWQPNNKQDRGSSKKTK